MIKKPLPPATLRDLRHFGFLMAGMLVLFSGIPAWKGHWGLMQGMWVVAGLFLAPALLYPASLRPIHKAWMKLALFMGWVNQNVILTLLYFLLFTPIALAQRLIGRDALQRKFPGTTKTTHWHDRSQEKSNPKHFQRQF